ncbi:MAG: hypothetical protein IT384_16745 [Deltaproteobacteria bacterium]|nr:hypothetical protein [Deltaproteobacteria bacterium]
MRHLGRVEILLTLLLAGEVGCAQDLAGVLAHDAGSAGGDSEIQPTLDGALIDDAAPGGDATQPADGAPVDGDAPDSGGDAGSPDGGSADGGIVPTATVCSFAVQRPAANATWQQTGPTGGNVTAILPLGQGVVLAATSPTQGPAGRPGQGAGIYRSTDRGATFTRVIRFPSGAASVHSLIRAAATGAIYAAVGSISGSTDDGIYRSTNDGASFVRVNTGLHAGARPRGLTASPGTPERVYALIGGTRTASLSTTTSIYRADNRGAWTELAATGLDLSLGGATAILADSADRDRLYAVDPQRFYVSTQAGASFSGALFGSTFPPVGLRRVRALFADPATPGRLLLTTEQELFESPDGGTTWTALATFPLNGARDVAFSGATTLAIADDQGLMSSAGGANFAPLGLCTRGPEIHRLIAVAPDDPGLVFLAAIGPGLYRSLDRGRHFTPQARGIEEALGRMVVTRSGTTATAWALSAAGLYRLEPDHQTWSAVGGSLDATGLADLAVDPADPDSVLIATNADLFEGTAEASGVVRLSLAAGTAAPAAGLGGLNVARVAFDPTRAGRAYAYQLRGLNEETTVPIGVYLSINGGRDFTASTLRSFDPDPFYPYVFPSSPLAVTPNGDLFAGALAQTSPTAFAHEVWRSIDGGATFGRVWFDDGAPDALANVIHAAATGSVYVGGRTPSAPLLESTNGTAFQPIQSGVLSTFGSVIDLASSDTGALFAVSGSTVAWAPPAGTFSALTSGFAPESGAVAVAYLPAQGGAPALVLIATLSSGFLWRTAP